MSKDKMTKQGNNQNSEQMGKKGSHQPEEVSKGYQPNSPESLISNDNLPQGGTGQSSSGSDDSSSSQTNN